MRDIRDVRDVRVQNIAVFVTALGVGFLAIHGARMFLYFSALGAASDLGDVGPLDGTYVIAWLPPFGASLLMGAMLLWALRAPRPLGWVVAWGLALGGIWLIGADHTFHPTPGRPQPTAWDFFGLYSWYVMPLLGALGGAYVGRRFSARA